VRLMDEETSEVKWDILAHRTSTTRNSEVALSPNGAFVASFLDSYGLQWKLWDVESGMLHMAGATHDGTGACICSVPELDDTPVVQQGCPVVAHTDTLSALTFSSCGQMLATGAHDHAVIIWDARTGVVQHHITVGQSDRAMSLSFSADGTRLASASWDYSFCVWDVSRGVLMHRISNPTNTLSFRVQFSPTNNRMIVSASNDKITLWDVGDDETAVSMSVPGVGGEAVFSPDGHTIATIGDYHGGRNVHLVNVDPSSKREDELILRGHQSKVLSVSWSSDGSKLVSGDCRGTCKLWDSSTGSLIRTTEIGECLGFIACGRDWVLEKQRAALAVAMGHHPRLGAGSHLRGLDDELVRMILDLLKPMQE
jgi:WD40 repeat protein